MTPGEFIAARLAEDEAIAREFRSVYFHVVDRDTGAVDIEGMYHLSRHSPARVLRQCAAIREALDSIGTLLRIAANSEVTWDTDAELARDALAGIWSDHPDFDPRWAN
jgi:hypothetical protein